MKHKSILFITLCMVLCLIPSVGMLFFPTTQTTENRAMAPAPKLTAEDGSLNKSFFADFESYFTEHMALRNPLVFADAKIQTTLFQESNVSGVIDGTDGWLYYSSTLIDYQGTDVLSDRALHNLSNNFSIVQDYLRERNIDFVLTIAPNKNTLYGENMPYYKSLIVNSDHSAKLLSPYLAQQEVAYLDLFNLFEQQDEVLYLKQDSHWNRKGAFLVYDAIMDILALPHEDYADNPPELLRDDNGDLSKMLYSFYGKPEENYSYDVSDTYHYANEVDSVEDGWIITENPDGTGTLLMFRDSFANTLIPFFSAEFETAYYAKGEPNAMERYVESYDPDCVVIQKVERNITNYLENPPILTPPEGELPLYITIAETETTVQIEECMNDPSFYKLSGTLDPERMETDSETLVCVNGKYYRAYQTDDQAYMLYLKKDSFAESFADVQLYIVNGATCVQALSETVNLS